MWLSDISPLRAGTVGSLSDNNLAEINVPNFLHHPSIDFTFLKRPFWRIYSFPVHNFVISTKNKLPLAVYFPVSYTEIGAGISRKKIQVPFKSNDIALIFNRFQFIKLSDNTVAGPKSVCIPCKRQRSAALRPPKKRADGLQFSAVRTRKRTIFVRILEHEFQYSPISEHVRCFQDSCAEHIGTPSSFPDLVRMPLRGPIYKERK